MKTLTAILGLLPVLAAQANNDAFASAYVIGGPSGQSSGNNVGYSYEAHEPAHHGLPGERSAWWTWTAPATGMAHFNTVGSNFDTVLAVYQGNEMATLSYVGSNDDWNGIQSAVSFFMLVGQTYRIAVDGWAGSSGFFGWTQSEGSIVLNWSSTVNNPPVLANPLAEQQAQPNVPFSFVIPANTFVEPDAGQTVDSYSVSGLPAWLSFNPITRTLSGTPTGHGPVSITVRAWDDGAPSAYSETTLSIAVLGAASPPPGLIAWWRGFGNADDLFGRADGTFHNGMTASGGVFNLDGSDDTIVIGQPPILDQPNGTWCAWIRPTTAPIGRGAVVMSRWEDNDPAKSSVSLFIYRPGPGDEWFLQGNISGGPRASDWSWAISPAVIQPDTWTHVALTFDDATDSLKIHINGELQGTATQTGSIFHGTGQWRIGFNPHGTGSNCFPGQISDPMIFSRALSETELQGITAAGLGGFAADGAPAQADPLAAQRASVGQPFTFTVPAATFGGPGAGHTLSYTASGLPAWLSFDPVTRTFSGTPDVKGLSTITVTATEDTTPPRRTEAALSLQVLGAAGPPPGLVAWWRGFGNADDVFGRADGTFANGMIAAGGIFNLDGSDDTMLIGQPPILDQPNGTWAAWIRPAGLASGRSAPVVSRWEENDPIRSSVVLFLHRPGPGEELYLQGNVSSGMTQADWLWAQSPVLIPQGAWTHVALSFDDATDSLQVFVNGELQGSGVQPGPLFRGDAPWRLGWNPQPNGWAAFPGQISDPMVFNHALSAAELQSLTSAGVGGLALNSPPTLAAALPAQQAYLGQPFTFTVPAGTFTDPDAGQTLTYSASGLPGWLSFDTATRTFSGTPPALGTTTVTVTATDSGALSLSTPFTVTAGFSPNAVVARYNFTASGFSAPNLAPELRGSFTVTFEPITGNGFSVAQLDAVVFQLRGQTFSPANAAVVVQNGRRTGAGLANHEGLFTFGGTTSGDAYGLSSGVTDFALEFSDSAGVFSGPTFSFSLAGVPGIFTASSVTVTRAAAAPVFTAKYAFSATGFSPTGPDATVAGSFTATFQHTGLTGGAGWVPSSLEMLDLTINGVTHDPELVDLNVRNVSVWPQGFNARFELGGRFSAYGGGMNTDDFRLYFTDFGGIGDGIASPEFVYTTTLALGFHTASSVSVTRVAADPLPGGDIAVEQPAGSPAWSGLTTVDFGTVSAGSPVSRTFTVRNHGAGSLTGLAVTLFGPAAADYTVTQSPDASVPAGGDTTFTVTCHPVASGTRAATLRLRTSDPRENPFEANLIAVGEAPEIAVEQPASFGLTDAASSVNFGPANLGGAPVSRVFTVRNTGTGTLTLGAVTVAGGESGDFSVGSGGLPATLGPASSANFTVSFLPTASGPRGTTLVIASSDADEANFEVSLSGTGVENRPPNTMADSIQRVTGSEIAKVPVAALIGNDSDPDGDSLSLVAVGDPQPAGASVGVVGGWVIYRATSPAEEPGSFTYSVSDGHGHTVVVPVQVNAYTGPTDSGLANAVRIEPAGDDIVATFIGVPGRSYRVQFTAGGPLPLIWSDFSSSADYVAPPNGIFQHTDVQPTSPVRLYRAVAR